MDWTSALLGMLAAVLQETPRRDAVCVGFGLAVAVGGWLLYWRAARAPAELSAEGPLADSARATAGGSSPVR